MGPFDLEKQLARKKAIASLLLNTNLSDDARVIWEYHLNNITLDEGEYNHRVKQIFGGTEWNRYTGTHSPILLDQ
jgi:hypothetical protein